MTFGHQDGTYIFDDHDVNLTEEYIGILKTNGAVPFFLDMTDEGKITFETLTNENALMEMRRFHADF